MLWRLRSSGGRHLLSPQAMEDAAEFNKRTRPSADAPAAKGGQEGKTRRRAPGRLSSAIAAGGVLQSPASAVQAHVQVEAVYYSDLEVHRAIRKMFPDPWLQGVPLPPLEDLVNAPDFRAWRVWAQANDVHQGSPQAFHQRKGLESAFLGVQRGATGSKHAVDPVVVFGLRETEHYRAAVSAASSGRSPLAVRAIADPDLTFDAERTVANSHELRGFRDRLIGVVKELAARTGDLSAVLRGRQRGHIAKVAGKLALGMVAVCVVLIGWPDWRLPMRFVIGFQVIEALGESGLWQLVDTPPPAMPRRVGAPALTPGLALLYSSGARKLPILDLVRSVATGRSFVLHTTVSTAATRTFDT